MAMWSASSAAAAGRGPRSRNELRLSCACLPHNELRTDETKRRSSPIPRIERDLLVSGDDEVTAQSGREVTDDRGLDVELRLHLDASTRSGAHGTRPRQVPRGSNPILSESDGLSGG